MLLCLWGPWGLSGCSKDATPIVEEGEPAPRLRGKAVYRFALTAKAGEEMQWKGVASDPMLGRSNKLPFAEEHVIGQYDFDNSGKLVKASAGNKVFLEGEGKKVKMGDLALWREGDRAVAFDGHFDFGSVVFRGRFAGAFDPNGKLAGAFDGMVLCLQVRSDRDGGIVYSVKGLWKVAKGEFSFTPVKPEEQDKKPGG